jgi:hypothetical protein
LRGTWAGSKALQMRYAALKLRKVIE